MSKDLRHDAEQKLKAGDLKVLVATASMELGIDIGSVDLVVLVDRAKTEFGERKFLVVDTPGKGLTIAAYAAKADALG